MIADRRQRLARGLLVGLAIAAAALLSGTAYILASPLFRPYAPVRLTSGTFMIVVVFCGAVVAAGLERPRGALGAAPPIAAGGATVFGLVLAFPALTGATTNAAGLIDYALTQAVFAFFLLLPIAFFGACLGLVAGYLRQGRRA